MQINFLHKKKGFTLIEMLIYVALLVGIMLAVIGMILSFTGPYKQLSAIRALDESGLSSMERMTREIRRASSIDTTNSTFATSPGVLTLTQTSTTTKFYISASTLKVDVNGTYDGPLTQSNVSVTSLIFTKLTSPNSTGIKIDMTLQATSSSVVRTKTFHTTVILKGT